MNSAWPARESRPYHWVSYAVVDQNWKLVSNNDSSYVELFNIAVDPYEKTDLKEREPEVVRVVQEARRLENNTSEQTDREGILGGKIAVACGDCCSVVPTESTEFSVASKESRSVRRRRFVGRLVPKSTIYR